MEKIESKKQQKIQRFLIQILRASFNSPLQTNKVKQALKIFDVIQTIDRIALIDEISSKLNTLSETKTKILYSVNIGNEIQNLE